MSEPTLEEIVTRLEKFTSMFAPDSLQDIGALITSWRARGEALKEARDVVERANEERWAGAFGALHSIDAALKDTCQ